MTVADLLEQLRDMPDTAVVWIQHVTRDGFGGYETVRREVLRVERDRDIVAIRVGRKE